MTTKDPNEIVAVKCEGCFTEWYSPNYRDPYEDSPEYREYCEEMRLVEYKPSVLGPAIGDCEDDFITDDLQCHAERMCVDSSDWMTSAEDYKAAIGECLHDGQPRVWRDTMSDQTVKITPYRRCDMPPVNEASLEIYGPYTALMRERIADI